tara:strand:- start:2669 stop:4732 length:2064 start_codon:yes stop_codon:yes gene_type:complete
LSNSHTLDTDYESLKQVQNHEKFCSWTWDIANDSRQWSDEIYKIVGVQPKSIELKPEYIWEFIHVDDRERVRNAVNDSLKDGKPYNIEYRIIRKDGVERIVHAVADVYFDDKSHPAKMVGTLYDVTDSKKNIDKIFESEQKFRGLLETAYDPIIIVDEKGKIEFANRQTKNTLGYSSEELMGQPVEVLVPEWLRLNHQNKRENYMKNPLSRPMGHSLSLAARRKDGSEFPVEISLSPFKTRRGTIVTAFIRNMTDIRRAENQQKFLAETSQLLSETMDLQERIHLISDQAVPTLADVCAVYIHDSAKLNLKAVAHSPNLDAEHVRNLVQNGCFFKDDNGLSFTSIAKTGVPKLIDHINDQVLKEVTSSDENCEQQLKGLHVQSLIAVPMQARGRTIGVICFIRCKPLNYTEKDLGYLKIVAERAAFALDNARLYKEAQDAIRLREDVLAVVSHDLRNPLGIIHGFNDLLAESFRNSKDQQREENFTEAIGRSLRHMERLIGDLLDFAKIESGTFTIEAKPYQIGKLFWESAELVKRHADEKKIQIFPKFSPSLSEIMCDSDRLKQVFMNLLGNAIKFSPVGGVIKVGAKETPVGIEFSVTDTGPGIPTENLPHIFDRYWQAKETAKLGTGLGLSIAKGIVESHGGKIWVKSMMGAGTTFYFTIPRNRALKVKVPYSKEIKNVELRLH